jgi:hypothetical protein
MAEDSTDTGLGTADAGLGPAGQGGQAGTGPSTEGGGTGDSRVDETVARLDELADAPLEEHPAIFERILTRLREVLGELSPGPPGAPGPPPGNSGAP